MKKDTSKTETHYSFTVKVNNELELIEIVQEENVIGRNAITVRFNRERWRTSQEIIELLQKIEIVIKENFT